MLKVIAYRLPADTIYKFNQISLFAVSSGKSVETTMAQTMNLAAQDCLLVISNAVFLKQLALPKKTI